MKTEKDIEEERKGYKELRKENKKKKGKDINEDRKGYIGRKERI